jgi:hypothetical protein
MTTQQHEPSDMAVHEFLQLLAGWVPDEELAAVRRTLAGGQPTAAVAAAAAMVTWHHVPLVAQDMDAARSLAGKPDVLTSMRPVPRYPRLPFLFSPFGLEEGPDQGLETDELDEVMAQAAEARSAQVAGVWRTWRLPLEGFGLPDAGDEPADDAPDEDEIRPSAAIDPGHPDRAHRIYLVQVPDSVGAPGLWGELQAALAGHGDAGVEVLALNRALRPYQAAALNGSALLWYVGEKRSMTARSRRTDMTGHELLLRLAGRLSDRTLAQARQVLAAGSPGSAIDLVAGLLAVVRAPLTADELTAIRDLTGDAGALPGVRPVAEVPELRFAFSYLDGDGEVERDDLDEAVVAAAEAHSEGLVGVWRAWRYLLPEVPAPVSAAEGGAAEAYGAAQEADPDDAAAAPPPVSPSPAADYLEDPFEPYRVYIVQVEDPAMIDAVATDLLDGMPDPASAGVEVVTLGEEPPPYQQAALAESLLLWATVAAPQFAVARVFDFADPVAGPGFAPDHAIISDLAERNQLLTYLRGGHAVLTTTATMDDILDGSVGSVVPTSFRTDGEWIWTDTVEYYLSQYGLAPDAELTEHIQHQVGLGHAVPDTDTDTAVEAADFLLNPPATPDTTAVWFPDGRPADGDAADDA